MKFKVFTVFLLLVLIATGVYAGYSYRDSRQVEAKVSVTEVPIYIEVPVEKVVTQFVEVPIEKVVVQEKPVTVPLRDFESLDELDAFLAGFDVKQATIPNGYLFNQCEDRALYMISQAEQQGYRLHFTFLLADSLYRFYGVEVDKNAVHAVVLAIVGEGAYCIEPQNNKWFLIATMD